MNCVRLLPLKFTSDCSSKTIFLDDVSATQTDWVLEDQREEYSLEVSLFVFHLYTSSVFWVMKVGNSYEIVSI